MKVFVTGGTGLLGGMLLRTAPKDIEIFSNYHENKLVPNLTDRNDFKFDHLDTRDKNELQELFLRIKPDVIIHTAAKASPDFCELNQKVAWEINVEGTRNILKIAREIRSKVLFISSNQVFSGKNPPYNEEAQTDPVNFYGRTKVQSEDDVLIDEGDAMVVRLMTMYGWGNPRGQKNTATWVIESLSNKKPIKVVDDIYNNFLWVGRAAEAIWKIVQGEYNFKRINIAGGEISNRYEFANKVSQIFNLDNRLITPVKKSFFTDEAPRPTNTTYDIGLFEKELNQKALSLNEGLGEMKNWQDKVKWKNL